MTTLVATVGLSPAAVAHAVATLRPARLVLVHTTGSAVEARRLRTFAEPIVPGPVDAVSIGDGVEFGETFRLLTCALRGGPDARGTRIAPVDDVYQLDHTGGPKIVTACAVARHHADHGAGGAALRSWVDDARGQIRFGGSRPALPTAGIDLAALAALHGFTLHGHATGGVRIPVDAAAVLAALDAADPRRVGQWRAELLTRCHPYTLGGVTGPPWRDAAASRGAAFEMAVAATALTVEGIDEVGLGLEPRDGEPGQLTDIDVVVRRGARVVVIEAKRRPGDLVPGHPGNRDGRQAGDQVALARLVFGLAARTLLVTGPGGADAESAVQDVEASVNRLAPAVSLTAPSPAARAHHRAPAPAESAIAHVALSDRAGVTALADAVSALLPPVRTDRRLPRPPRVERAEDATIEPSSDARPAQARAYRDLVVPVSGTVLGVAAHIRAVRADTTRLLGSTELCAALTHALPRAEAGRLDRPIVPESGLDDGIPHGRLPAPGTGAVAVGPGPKRVTAALVVQALTQGLDLVHVGLDGQVRSWRHGSWAADGRVGWAEHLADSLRPITDARDVAAPLRGVAERVLDEHPDAALLVPVRTDQIWLPDLLIGFDGRCDALVAPADSRAGRGRVRAVAAHLAQLVGDAATLHVLLPAAVADRDSWERTARLRGWRTRVPSRP